LPTIKLFSIFMTPENFCYWLQGLFEVQNPRALTEAQTAVVKEHLQTVFNKRTKKTVERPKSLPPQAIPTRSVRIC